MKTSPILGLPIAEPDDFTANYPVEVDEPRTLGLDTRLTIPYGSGSSLSWVSLPAGTSRCAPFTAWVTQNGVTTDNDGGFIFLPKAGLYLVTATASAHGLGVYTIQAQAGDASGVFAWNVGRGSYAYPVGPNTDATSVVSQVIALEAGVGYCLYVHLGQAATFNAFDVGMTYLAPPVA